MDHNISERRQYLRLEAAVGLRVISEDKSLYKPAVKNLSPLGIMFESPKEEDIGKPLELTLMLPETKNPVHIRGKVVWNKKTEHEGSPLFQIGCEFSGIEEDNKDTLLRFFCDLIYKLGKGDKIRGGN